MNRPVYPAGHLTLVRALACALIFSLISSLPALAQNYTAADLFTITAGANIPSASGHPIGLDQFVVGWTGSFGAKPTVWTDSGTTVLTSPTGIGSFAKSGRGNQVVGETNEGGSARAVLWDVTSPTTPTILAPAGFSNSRTYDTDGTSQVGYGQENTQSPFHIHALLWQGSAQSAVDLHSSLFTDDYAYAVNGSSQVGFGLTADSHYHAVLWSGSAASAMDLHPAALGFSDSQASAVGDGQQAGLVYNAGDSTSSRAAVWSGTPGSGVNLHPDGFTTSWAQGVGSGFQVGEATGSDGQPHAMIWRGTPASAIDLHRALPSNFVWSRAYAVDAKAVVLGVALDSNNVIHAIAWTPTVVITSISRAPGGPNAGHVTITGHAYPNASVTIQASSLPGSFTNPGQIVSADSNGDFTYEDTNAGGLTVRFYRASLP